MIVAEITSGQWAVLAGLGALMMVALLALAWLTWYCDSCDVKKGGGYDR